VYVGTSRMADSREIIVGAPAAYYDDAGYIVIDNVVFKQLLNDDAVYPCCVCAGRIIFCQILCYYVSSFACCFSVVPAHTS